MLPHVLKVLLLSLASLGLMLGMPAASPASLQAGDFEYFLEGGQAILSRYTGTERALSLPTQLDGHPLTGIAPGAFAGISGLTNLSLPEGLIFISDQAFWDSPELKYITLPQSLAQIGPDAFLGCSPQLVLMVVEGSLAHQYAEAQQITFTYQDCGG